VSKVPVEGIVIYHPRNPLNVDLNLRLFSRTRRWRPWWQYYKSIYL